MRKYIFILFTIIIFNFKAFSAEKEYSDSECKTLGLTPIVLPNGVKILPKHDGEHFFVQKAPIAADITPEQVVSFFENAKNLGRQVNDFLNLQYVSKMPVVIHKQIGSAAYEIGLDKLIFTPQGNTITIFARILTAEGNSICFAGEQVGFTGQGGIKDGILKLILGGDNVLKLAKLKKIDIELTGGQIKFGCNGYESFSLDGKVIFDRSLIVPENSITGEVVGGNVESTFKLIDITEWSNMLIDISMTPFQMPSMEGFGFQVTNAVIDISDASNSPKMSFPQDYVSAEDGVLWQGAYIGNINIRFPKHFKNRTSPNRIEVGVNALLIDRIGVSGEVYGKNLLELKNGDLNGWDYSLESASIVLVKNKVKAGSLGGRMRVSITSEEKVMSYNAIIDPSRDYYNFSVSTDEGIDFPFLKAAEVKLEPASKIELILQNKEFKAKATLYGSLGIKAEALGLELTEYRFERLVIATKAPYLAIGFFGGGPSDKEQTLGNFPITLRAPTIMVSNNEAMVDFGLGVNLDNVGISATGGMVITGAFENINNRHFWKNKNFDVKDLSVSANLSAVSFEGRIAFFKNDPIYGKGFAGSLDAFIYLNKPIGIAVVGIFGRKDKKPYWLVDGELQNYGGGGSGISVNLLAGCVFKNMSPTSGQASTIKTLSGVTYAPDFNVGWGGRFGIGFSVSGGDAFSALAGLEIVTRADGSLSKIGILGSVAVGSASGGSSPGAASQMYRSLCADSDFTQPGGLANQTDGDPNAAGSIAGKFVPEQTDKGFGATIILKFNFDTREYYGKVGATVVVPSIKLQVVGAFLFGPEKWFIHLGEPPLSQRIIIQLPSFPTIDGYIMLGHGITALPDPEPNIFKSFPSKSGQRTSAVNPADVASAKGIAFGAAVSVASAGKYLVLSYSIGARAGLDMMLTKYAPGCYCLGREGQPIGINNWRAAGQLYAIGWLKGQAFGFDVVSVELGALLKGAAPNPTYGTGQVALKFKVLMKKFDFNLGFQLGEDCEVVGGQLNVENINVVNSTDPADGATYVDVEKKPTVLFTEKIDQPVSIEGLDGKARIKIKNFEGKDESGATFQGSFNSSNTNLNFTPSNGSLMGGKSYTMSVAYNLEIQKNGNWETMEGDNGEIKSFSFKTGKTTEQLQAEIQVHATNAKEELKNQEEKNQKDLDQIEADAEVRAAQINAEAALKAEEIRQESQKKAASILKLAENSPPKVQEKVKEVVDSALVKVDSVLDGALNKVKKITDDALVDVKKVTSQAKIDVANTYAQANSNIDQLESDGNSKIITYKSSRDAKIKALEKERRDKIKWWMGRKKKDAIKAEYKQKVENVRKEYQGYMEAVPVLTNASIDAEKQNAITKGNQIVADAQERCKNIMDNAARDAKAVMADAEAQCKAIMAEAEAVSRALVAAGDLNNPDLNAVVAAAKDSFKYNESDEGGNDSDDDVPETTNPSTTSNNNQKPPDTPPVETNPYENYEAKRVQAWNELETQRIAAEKAKADEDEKNRIAAEKEAEELANQRAAGRKRDADTEAQRLADIEAERVAKEKADNEKYALDLQIQIDYENMQKSLAESIIIDIPPINLDLSNMTFDFSLNFNF